MANVAVPYYSEGGHTLALAEQIAGGLGDLECNARLINIEQISDLDWQAMDLADAIVFGCPTFMGSAAGQFKIFMDKTSDRWADQVWADKVAAGFTVGSRPAGDKLSTLTQLAVFAAQHSMIWVGQNLTGMPTSDAPHPLNATGSWLGLAGTEGGHGEAALSQPELELARLFGQRIAKTALRWNGAAG